MITLGVAVTVTTVVALAVAQAVDFGVFNLRIHVLNADKHSSIFGVGSLLAQTVAAAACIGRSRVVRARWRAWFGLGALVGALVLIRGLTTFNAVVLAVPLACVFALVFVLTWSDGTSRIVVWAGLVLLAISLLLHKVGLAADASTASDYTWPYQVQGIVKHGAELAGWILVATGVAAGATITYGVRLAASPQRASAVGISPSSD